MNYNKPLRSLLKYGTNYDLLKYDKDIFKTPKVWTFEVFRFFKNLKSLDLFIYFEAIFQPCSPVYTK